MNRLRRLSDPFWSGVFLAVALVVTGFIAVALTWRGVARTIFVPTQVAWLSSGGLAAIALLAAGLGVLNAQLDRRDAAAERARVDAAIDDAVAALVATHDSA